jgi:hypothetical protein
MAAIEAARENDCEKIVIIAVSTVCYFEERLQMRGTEREFSFNGICTYFL